MAGPLKPLDLEAMDKIALGEDDLKKMDSIAGPLSPEKASPWWDLPLIGRPPESGREAAARMVGTGGMSLLGPLSGPLAAGARIGLGAGTGAIRDGMEGAGKGAMMQAALEAIAPVLGFPLRVLPGVRHQLPQRPAVTDTQRTWSHSPWSGQTQQIPGPQPSPILNPAGQPARYLPAPPPPSTGPVNMTERSFRTPAKAYIPNIPQILRAILGLEAGKAMAPSQEQQDYSTILGIRG